jgi:hypothetical protein
MPIKDQSKSKWLIIASENPAKLMAYSNYVLQKNIKESL